MIDILSEKLEILASKCNDYNRVRKTFLALLDIGITEEQIEETFVIHNETPLYDFDFKIKILEYISEKWNELPNEYYCIPSISELKKKIKYSKNPMEKKMLEKQLHKLYKNIKRNKIK